MSEAPTLVFGGAEDSLPGSPAVFKERMKYVADTIPNGNARLLLLPAAAGARGVVLSVVRRKPRWIPYYVAFAVLNYTAMVGELVLRRGH